jgi:hypothetical protein
MGGLDRAEPPCGHGRPIALDGQSKVAIGFTTYVFARARSCFAKARIAISAAYQAIAATLPLGSARRLGATGEVHI